MVIIARIKHCKDGNSVDITRQQVSIRRTTVGIPSIVREKRSRNSCSDDNYCLPKNNCSNTTILFTITHCSHIHFCKLKLLKLLY